MPVADLKKRAVSAGHSGGGGLQWHKFSFLVNVTIWVQKGCAWSAANRPRWSEMIVVISWWGNNINRQQRFDLWLKLRIMIDFDGFWHVLCFVLVTFVYVFFVCCFVLFCCFCSFLCVTCSFQGMALSGIFWPLSFPQIWCRLYVFMSCYKYMMILK